jgi:Flp pilus assembly protein TadG
MRTRLNGERGQAMLETAVVLPIVLLVSISIFEFGRAYQVFQIMTNAAREGARVAVLPSTSDADIKQRVTDYLTAGSIGNVNTAVVNIDHTATISIGGGTAPATAVSVNYPFNFLVLNPVARLVVGNSALGGAFTMTTSALMRNE